MAEFRAFIAAFVAFDRPAAAALSAYAESGVPDVDPALSKQAMTRCGIDRWSKRPDGAGARLERAEAQAAAAG